MQRDWGKYFCDSPFTTRPPCATIIIACLIHNTLIQHFETWLSLVERLVRDQEVAGSNPVVSTILHNNELRVRPQFFIARPLQAPRLQRLFFVSFFRY